MGLLRDYWRIIEGFEDYGEIIEINRARELAKVKEVNMLKKHKRGENIGVTALARLKARGLIPRTDGTKKKGKLGKS